MMQSGFLALVASLVSQNFGNAFAKGLFPLVGPGGVAALRVGFSALLLILFFRPWRYRLQKADCINLLFFGAALGIMNLTIYMAFSRIPIGVGVAIEITGPLLLAVFASRKALDFLWVGLAVSGLLLLLPIEENVEALDPVGVLFAMAASVCWALYIVFGKKVSSLRNAQAVGWGMLIAAFVTVPFGITEAGETLLEPPILAAGLLAAILCSTIPYSLEIIALRNLPRRVFSLLVSMAPAIGAIAAWIMLDETLSLFQWTAIFLIIAASAGCAATASRTGQNKIAATEKK